MSFCDAPLDFSIKKPKLDDGQQKCSKKLNSSPKQLKVEPAPSPASTPPSILSHNHVQLHLQQHLNRNRDDQVEFIRNDEQNQKPSRSPLSIQLPMPMNMDGHFPFLNLPLLENHHENHPLIYPPPAEIHKISPTSTSVLDGNSTAVVGNVSSSKNSRITRPFKAYPKDPLTFNGMYGLTLGGGNGQANGPPSNGLASPLGSTETLINQQSNQAYAEFRKQMLRQVQQETIKGQQQQQQQLNGGKNKRMNGLLTTTSPGHHDTSPASMFMSQFATSLAANFNGAGGVHNDSLLLSSPDLNHNSSSEEGSGGGHSSGGSGVQSKNTKRVSTSTTSGKTDQQLKDEAYWERRRKNNEAAKRSRDARRAKEDEIAIRAAFLEQENLKLRFELCALKNETAKLRYMLYNG